MTPGLSLRARAPGRSSEPLVRLRMWLWSRSCERPSRVAWAPAVWAGVAAPSCRIVPMCSAGRSRCCSRQEKRKHSKASQFSPFLSWPQRKRDTPCSPHACHGCDSFCPVACPRGGWRCAAVLRSLSVSVRVFPCNQPGDHCTELNYFLMTLVSGCLSTSRPVCCRPWRCSTGTLPRSTRLLVCAEPGPHGPWAGWSVAAGRPGSVGLGPADEDGQQRLRALWFWSEVTVQPPVSVRTPGHDHPLLAARTRGPALLELPPGGLRAGSAGTVPTCESLR